jgi:hypothetical protein
MGYKDPEAKKAARKAYYEKNKEKAYLYNREYAQVNKEKIRCYVRQRNYGITSVEYNRMLTSQNGVCACCYTSSPGGQHNVFNVDHCHKTGKIRGLLCYSCNVGIGHLGDNFQSVSNAITYLSKNEPPIFPGIWKRITPPILPTSLKLLDPPMLKGCSSNKLSKETMGNADTVVAPRT